ncbi:hypothetical protein [Methylococcus geothermalis]|uniref:Uncharacterized protein n=1 Tax=Methylococcus geothermalis TaxID=2681310 RepID=A0A858Q3V2_9GAMM|nr:hypothetical protein [Methylococcus geothermalis]QJD28509.1 hypothetical protein GNH96_00010 [Methylococcus geothermalis]
MNNSFAIRLALLSAIGFASSVLLPRVGFAQGALLPGTEVPLPDCAGWMRHAEQAVTLDSNAAYLYVEGLPTHPAGGHFRFRYEFPRARHISWQNYDLAGRWTALLADTEIVPDVGSVNPFRPDVPYASGQVSYTIDVLDVPPAERPLSGSTNILYGGYMPDGTPIDYNSVLYRIYVPDPGTDVLGGVPWPQFFFVVDDPAQTSLETIDNMCNSMKRLQKVESRRAVLLTDRLLKPSAKVAKLRPVNAGDTDAVVYEATSPGQESNAIGREGGSGYYINVQTGYVAMSLTPASGIVIAAKFRSPTVPDTEAGQEISGSEDLRYWSICMQQKSVLLFTTSCLHDTQIKIDDDGYVRMAFSYPEDKPVIGGQPYGNWLALTDIQPIAILRQTQPRSDFSESLFYYTGARDDTSAIAAHMGDYFPVVKSCSKVEFESNRCGL